MIIRQRQSSVICATQVPVTSTCAASRGERAGGGPGGPGGCAEAASAIKAQANAAAARNDCDENMKTPPAGHWPPEDER